MGGKQTLVRALTHLQPRLSCRLPIAPEPRLLLCRSLSHAALKRGMPNEVMALERADHFRLIKRYPWRERQVYTEMFEVNNQVSGAGLLRLSVCMEDLYLLGQLD